MLGVCVSEKIGFLCVIDGGRLIGVEYDVGEVWLLFYEMPQG